MKLPIRIRLTAAFSLMLAVALIAVGVLVFVRFRTDANAAIDVELRNRANSFFAARSSSPQLRRDLLGLTDEFFGQAVDRNGDVTASSPQLGRSGIAPVTPTGFRTTDVVTHEETRRVRLFVRTRRDTTVVLATALDDSGEALSSLVRQLWLGGSLAWLVASGLALLLARAALRPVERLRQEAASFSATDLTRRIAEPTPDDELARLARTLNAMLGRIQDSFERQRSFVDHASHELRTPLANLSLELELALRRQRSEAELRSALVSAADEAKRLDRLASNLLVLARTTDGNLQINRETTDLEVLVRATADGFSARAESEGVAIVTTVTVPDLVMVDPIRIRQALTNLVDNALRVTPSGGTVTVSAAVDDQTIELSVADTGPGFPEVLRENAFGLFVRGPTADRSTNGAGLGLAIVAAVAEAHGGAARIEELDTGARISVRIPRSPGDL